MGFRKTAPVIITSILTVENKIDNEKKSLEKKKKGDENVQKDK